MSLVYYCKFWCYIHFQYKLSMFDNVISFSSHTYPSTPILSVSKMQADSSSTKGMSYLRNGPKFSRSSFMILIFCRTPGIRRGGFLPSPLMPLCSIIEGKSFAVELTNIHASTTKNAFSVFHFIALYHLFNRKAHRAVLGTCMTMVAFLVIRFQLK